MATVRVAAIQMDSPAGQNQANLDSVERLARQAADQGAHIALFHEGVLVDYSEHPGSVAEAVPGGPATERLCRIAGDTGLYLGVGMAETEAGRLYITQVFCGPEGYVTKYRKTWIWYAEKGGVDALIRDEHRYYNPGTGPEPFMLGDVRATCLICADGNSERAWRQVSECSPQLVLFPNNRHHFRPAWLGILARAREIGAPIIATNRTGRSGTGICDGGALIASAEGAILGHCLRPGEEEIVIADVPLA